MASPGPHRAQARLPRGVSALPGHLAPQATSVGEEPPGGKEGPQTTVPWAKEPGEAAGSTGVTGTRACVTLGGRAAGRRRPGHPPSTSFRSFYRKLRLHLPKFSVSGSYSLDELLPQLGIRDLFSQRANLSGITAQENLLVSKVRGRRPQRRGLRAGDGAPPATRGLRAHV